MWCAVVALLALGTPQACLKEGAWPPPFCRDLDCPHYEVAESISEEPSVELRSYDEGAWVSTKINGVNYEKAVQTGFMRLFAYISGANEEMKKIPMTAPVRVEMTPGQGPFCEDHYKVSFYVPVDMQDNPPAPLSEDVYIDPAPATDYYVMSYGGRTNEKQIIDKATELLQLLDERGLSYNFDSFFHAGYDSPFRIFNRHNEVWVATGAAQQ
ncbi:hypothetical protein HYH03_006797 [Edaphochlamys debaryana]|uniref:Heme-binding protein 2 n=1 Tax=Edaphochlamys debaryana TaxID=47281 RepID=A0A836BZW8_9CHLO|nr:hypothetical protein HYH03_006797 [Edaphochlamys debaryana]|eukprot:KAG2495191.1 hypothetical protein HYH03_006797 [Edaphochlamys debaryana]